MCYALKAALLFLTLLRLAIAGGPRREEPDRLWSHAETAAFLGVPTATLHQWHWKGTGPRSYKIGRHRKYLPDEVMRWLEAQADPQRYAS